jgi:hypothetical protein
MTKRDRLALPGLMLSVLLVAFSCSYNDDDEDEDRRRAMLPEGGAKGRTTQRLSGPQNLAASAAHEGQRFG